MFSSDDHCGATASVYRQFMESRYLDDYDRWLGVRKEAFEATVGGGAVAPAEPTEAATFGMNLDVRLARLEQEGIVGEVLFPGAAAGPRFDDFSIPFSGIFGEAESDDEFELHAAGLRAHNRWQAETSPDLDRQIGLAIIAFHDVDAAVAEIHRSADSGLRGVLLEGIHPTLPALDDPIYDPMWTACEERSMPVHFHAGIGSQSVHRITGLGSNGKPRNDAITGVEAQWLSHRPLWFLIMGGVCERHPKLRIVFAELGATWAPDAMNHFRWYWDLGRTTPHEPMYYYDRQVFFGSSMFTKQDVEARALRRDREADVGRRPPAQQRSVGLHRSLAARDVRCGEGPRGGGTCHLRGERRRVLRPRRGQAAGDRRPRRPGPRRRAARPRPGGLRARRHRARVAGVHALDAGR